MGRKKSVPTQILAQRIEAYAFFGSFGRAAKALGVANGTIAATVYVARGLCRCSRTPEPGYTSCRTCLERAKRGKSQRYKKRKSDGVCVRCSGILSSVSTVYCEKHLRIERSEMKLYRQKRMESGFCYSCGDPLSSHSDRYCDQCLEKIKYQRNLNKMRGNYNKVLERDHYLCQICFRDHSDGKRSSLAVHHLIGRSNKLDNLITLCSSCHRVITALNNCPNPSAAMSFWLSKYN